MATICQRYRHTGRQTDREPTAAVARFALSALLNEDRTNGVA